jgi:DNA-binding GntR family transcriptional regulator
MTPRTPKRRSDSAYEALKQRIIQLELSPGSPIEETQLMESLGVGRTPLREALQRLSQEDLIKSIPRRGYFVANVNVTDPLHVFEVRKQLEGFSARLAAERATAAHMAEFDSFLEEIAQNADTGDFAWNIESDHNFHQLVAKASGNPFLQQTLDRLFNLTIRLLYTYNLRVTVVNEELAVYRSIVDAIHDRNPETAESAMRNHLGFPPLELKWTEETARETALSNGYRVHSP